TQIEQLNTQNNALRDSTRRLREDPSKIESVTRQELGLIRPGEKAFIIRNVAAPPGAPELAPARRRFVPTGSSRSPASDQAHLIEEVATVIRLGPVANSQKRQHRLECPKVRDQR